jgi:hypothetical protein
VPVVVGSAIITLKSGASEGLASLCKAMLKFVLPSRAAPRQTGSLHGSTSKETRFFFVRSGSQSALDSSKGPSPPVPQTCRSSIYIAGLALLGCWRCFLLMSN